MSLILPEMSPKGYPKVPTRIGEHIRKARMDRNLTQLAVSTIFRVSEQTILHWEKDLTEPELVHIPKIIEFLGYMPFERPPIEDVVRNLDFYKKVNGLSYERLAKVMNRHPEQLTDWISGRIKPSQKNLQLIAKFLDETVGSTYKQPAFTETLSRHGF